MINLTGPIAGHLVSLLFGLLENMHVVQTLPWYCSARPSSLGTCGMPSQTYVPPQNCQVQMVASALVIALPSNCECYQLHSLTSISSGVWACRKSTCQPYISSLLQCSAITWAGLTQKTAPLYQGSHASNLACLVEAFKKLA